MIEYLREFTDKFVILEEKNTRWLKYGYVLLG